MMTVLDERLRFGLGAIGKGEFWSETKAMTNNKYIVGTLMGWS